jgi:hypothetical protein
MFKDLQQQHVWLWPWHSHWNHQLAVGGGQQHTVTNILSFCLQTGSTEKLSAMVLATPTAKQMNDWIEEVCSLTFTSCEGYNTPQLHQVMTQVMHIQSHQEKKWGCYFSHVSSFKQQQLRGEREILRCDFQLLLSDHAPILELHAPIIFHKAQSMEQLTAKWASWCQEMMGE